MFSVNFTPRIFYNCLINRKYIFRDEIIKAWGHNCRVENIYTYTCTYIAYIEGVKWRSNLLPDTTWKTYNVSWANNSLILLYVWPKDTFYQVICFVRDKEWYGFWLQPAHCACGYHYNQLRSVDKVKTTQYRPTIGHPCFAHDFNWVSR